MNTLNSIKPSSSRKKARLKGTSPDGAEVVISSDGELEIIGGNPRNYNTLIRVAKTYLAVIKANGFDISNISSEEFAEVNTIIRELKEQNNT